MDADPDNPLDEGESKFDLKEIAEEDGYPAGLHAPQPSGRAGEGHFRVYLSTGFGR